MKKPLLSFHGEQSIKENHIARLQMHADADEIVQGQYWQNGKGCDTGCSFHSEDGDHKQWPIQLGIPQIIGKLRDRIFEGLPNAEAKKFPLACSNATPVGVDLENVWRRFMIWLLIDPVDGVIKHAKTERTRKAITDVAAAFQTSLTNEVSREVWNDLRKAAAAAAAAAYAAAAAAAAAAYAAADAAAAAAAAYAAADAAADAAAAAAAAYADAYAAADAAAAAAAAYADAAADAAAAAAAAYADAYARRGHYTRMSEKLIELLKSAA